jgi:hypothetical protein
MHAALVFMILAGAAPGYEVDQIAKTTTSAACLTFLHHKRQIRSRTVKQKSALGL